MSVRKRERERESESIRSFVFVAQKLFGFERESGWPDLAKIHHFIEFSKSLAKNWEDIRYFVKVYPTLAIYLCPIGLIFNILIAQILKKTFLSLVTLSRGWDWKWENSFKRKLLAPFVLSFLLSFFIPFLSSVIFCPKILIESMSISQADFFYRPALANFFKGPLRPLFRLFLCFQTNITILTANKCEKMSIQYTVLGFEPTTFRKWVSSHNHLTRAPPLL